MNKNVREMLRAFSTAVERGEPAAESALYAWMLMRVSPEMRGRGVENLAAFQIEGRPTPISLLRVVPGEEP
jgi:hypothetical protein